MARVLPRTGGRGGRVGPLARLRVRESRRGRRKGAVTRACRPLRPSTFALPQKEEEAAEAEEVVWSDAWVQRVLGATRTRRLYAGGCGLSSSPSPTASSSSSSSSSRPSSSLSSLSKEESADNGSFPTTTNTPVTCARTSWARSCSSAASSKQRHRDAVLLLEYRVWCAIDTTLRLLQELNPNGSSGGAAAGAQSGRRSGRSRKGGG